MDLTGLGSIADLIKTGVDKFWPPDADPAQKLEFEKFVEDSIARRDEAKSKIIVAETTQGDNFTKRARPMVVYSGLAMILINYVLFPFLARMIGIGFVLFSEGGSVPTAFVALLAPLNLPVEFWTAWGGVVSIWCLGRTAEKRGASGTLGTIANAITGSKK